jgi:hypothetical protein
MRSNFARAAAPALMLCPVAATAHAEGKGAVNIYSYRQTYLIGPLLEQFSGATGIKVNAIVPWSDLVKSWGDFKPDSIALNEIAAPRKKASEFVDKVGVDEGPGS